MTHATPVALALLLASTLATAGCDEDEARCSGAEILPHLSPVAMGDFYPRQGDPDPATNERVPFAWSLVLQSTCGAPLKISKACLIGQAHNGVDGDAAFALEGPDRAEVPPGEDTLVRLTYDHADVNALDADADGAADPDNIALVVQSNARNFPTLVVPVCARVVLDGATRLRLDCTAPVTVPAGESRPDLCP